MRSFEDCHLHRVLFVGDKTKKKTTTTATRMTEGVTAANTSMTIREVGALGLCVSASEDLAQDVLVGLSQQPKRLSPKYMYDDKGSDLYEKITQQEEYYLYNCEKEVLMLNKEKILGHLLRSGGDLTYNLVELGAGDGSKTRVLLEYFLEHNFTFKYMPIDISRGALETLSRSLVETIDGRLQVEGVCGDNLKGLQEISLASFGKSKSFVMFLGSSLGNSDHDEALSFLRKLWNDMNDGDMLLLGVDLQKDPKTVLPAYQDAAGFTTAFNLNLLDRLNRDLGATFDKGTFTHYHFYNPRRRCMESWLMSTVKQEVWVEKLSKSFSFSAWEGIHVEDSFKYNEQELKEMAQECGFEVVENLYDSKYLFVDCLWRVKKPRVSTPLHRGELF